MIDDDLIFIILKWNGKRDKGSTENTGYFPNKMLIIY